MKLLKKFFILLFFLNSVPLLNANDSVLLELQNRVKTIFNQKKHAVVRVFGESGDGDKKRMDICTGFFISKDGLVISIANIAQEANKVWVEYAGQPYKAKVLGYDKPTNLSILQVINPPRNLPIIHVMQLKDLPEPATFILAVTCQFGHEPGPAQGMITGWHTRFCDKTVFPTTYLRCDLAHDGGEGGSPVFDLNGRFIGIMAMAIGVEHSRSSFIVPAQAVLRIRDDLIFSGKASYAYIGIELDEGASRLNKGGGLVIGHVVEGGPAKAAGVKLGDVILEFNDKTIYSACDLLDAKFYARPGQHLTLKIKRKGKELTLPIVVDEQPFEAMLNPGPSEKTHARKEIASSHLTKPSAPKQKSLSKKKGRTISQFLGIP